MTLSAMCGNQLQWFIHPPGGAVMSEAEVFLQLEVSCSYCIIGIQYFSHS